MKQHCLPFLLLLCFCLPLQLRAQVQTEIPAVQDSVAFLNNYIPDIHDDIVIERLQSLEKNVKFPYHPVVRKHIERYLVKQREQTRLFVMRKDRYFPIFEEALARHQMPDEIKYLSIVESALLPKIQSWAAALGLWQFIPATGREYGLRQDAFMDERIDPYKSTDAACRYLKYLHKMFGDWHLALAAYNCGPGNVQRAIRRSGGKTTFWEIYNFLPKETRNYVPMFIAVNYVMNYYPEHYVPEPDERHAFVPSDTVHVSQTLYLTELAKQMEVPFETLQLLNPHLKKNMIPSYARNYPLRVPADKKAFLLEHQETIFKASTKGNYQQVAHQKSNDAQENTEGKKRIVHAVRRGEYLSAIAQKYGVSATDLRIWNKMNTNTVYVNQKLVIWKAAPAQKNASVASKPAPAPKVEEKKQDAPQEENTLKSPEQESLEAAAKFHTVRPGDTLWKISKNYEGLSVERIKSLNPEIKGDNLKAGQKIRVQ